MGVVNGPVLNSFTISKYFVKIWLCFNKQLFVQVYFSLLCSYSLLTSLLLR